MQNVPSDKAKLIDAGPADMAVRVDDDGVWLGFFPANGMSAVVSLDKILGSLPEGSVSRMAIDSWARDRRKQAAAHAG